MRFIKPRGIYPVILLFILSLIPLLNLLTPGLPITHDGMDHVARIANFYKNLSEGVLIPRWAGNLNWGYGHPILMFLYPLPSYITSFFHFFGAGLIDSLKLFFFASFILSGIFMYLWLKEFLGKNAAILGAVLYIFAPYRFVDLYVRGAIGEHAAFVFLPLILYALYKLNKLSIKDKPINYYGQIILIAIAFTLLILSHNAIGLMFIPFILFYILYLFQENKSKVRLILSAFSLILGFLLSFFFWFPAFMEGKYTLRDIVTRGEYSSRFVDLQSLLSSPWSFGISGQFSVQIGIIHIFLSILAAFLIYKLYKKKDSSFLLLAGSFGFLIVSIFLMLDRSSLVWEKLTILQKLQFPWRFLSVIVFLTSLMGAVFVSKVSLKNKNIIIAILIFAAIFSTRNFWGAKEYKLISDNFFKTTFNSTTDTGESAPIWSVRFMEKRPKEEIEVIEGSAEIKKVSRKTTYHKYLITTKEESRMRENTLYFPGWKVYDNGKEVKDVEFQDPKNRGLITFYLGRGIHNVDVKFEETRLRVFSNLISLSSILFVTLVFIILKFRPHFWKKVLP